MRLHRLISILLLIEAKGSIKAKELADKLEISARTVYRDIEELCQAGIPIAATSGPNGGIHLMEGYSVGISHLQEEDIINLYLSGMGIQPDRQSDMGVKINNALLKLEKNLSKKQNIDLSNIKKRFHFDETPWWGEYQPLQNLDALMHSVFRSRKLEITYEKPNGELSERRIHPYGIVVKRTEWYMIAYCERSKEIRTFKCERIAKSRSLNEGFSLPEDFSLEQHWKKSEAVFKDACAERENYPVTIKLHKERADILSDLEVVKLKENQGYITATINMYYYGHAADSIMKIAWYVDIIQPEELKAFVRDELGKLMRKYEGL